MSREHFRDFQPHSEFLCPDKRSAPWQGKQRGVSAGAVRNPDSGFLRHSEPGKGDCGAAYEQFAPLVYASRPASTWQTYDIIFRSPRVENGTLTKAGRLTALHNGRVIHNNVQLMGPTKSPRDTRITDPGPELLQAHGAPVAFRNIWAVRLPLARSDTYEPRS